LYGISPEPIDISHSKDRGGKIACLFDLTTAVLLRGVTTGMAPLIGLGSDQVNKATRLAHRVESYHINENKSAEFIALVDRLLSITKRNGRTGNSVIIFYLPQSLDPAGILVKFLNKLADCDIITLMWVDECHCIHRNGLMVPDSGRNLTQVTPHCWI